MTTASAPSTTPDRTFLSRVITAGLVVGVLDMAAASVLTSILRNELALGRVWRTVARALLGPDAANGGAPTVAFGLAMHYTVAMCWTIVFALLYRNFAWLRAATRTNAGAIAIGAVYGPLVWIMMSLVIVPMTRLGRSPAFTTFWFIEIGIHIAFVGLPIAWIVRDPRQ